MRIIGGELGGRIFKPPSNNWPTRPTTDYAREALYNILHHRMQLKGLRALDCFGGLGGHTLELLSRGCAEVVYVDKHRGCSRFVAQTAETFGVADRLTVLNMNVFTYLKQQTTGFDFVFADPPYALPHLETLPDLMFSRSLLNEGGLMVLEHGTTGRDFSAHPRFVQQRRYGDSVFSFFE